MDVPVEAMLHSSNADASANHDEGSVNSMLGNNCDSLISYTSNDEKNDSCAFSSTPVLSENAVQNNISTKPIEKFSEKSSDETTDAYDYTKTSRFTSEIFKIEIGNLPRFFGYGECKRLLTRKLKLKPHKINVVQHIRKAYVTFKNEENKLEALEKLKVHKHKGKLFEVKNAKPKADAMASKRCSEDLPDSTNSKKPHLDNGNCSTEDMLKNTVIPWWKKEYSQQLEDKHKGICESLTELRKRICAVDNLNNEVFRWFMQQKKKSGLCCPTKPILPSPIIEGYRNKCGFTVGKNAMGESVVGFRLGKYRNQTCAVEKPTNLVHVSHKMKQIAECFSDYVGQSKLDVYDKHTHQGHWRQITVRTTRKDASMATIAISQQNLTDDDIAKEKQAVKEHFKLKNVSLDTLLFRVVSSNLSNLEATPAIPFDGEGVIFENLFDLKFRISPDAFFQCNTAGAEVLYKCVQDMVLTDVTPESDCPSSRNCNDAVVLDVCCGTGTIGLCLAHSVNRVIGIDICQQAIEDAKMNAKLNDISNVEYYCGPAEDVLPAVINQVSRSFSNIIAVVDPPRCGLHHKVIKAIRQCSFIKRLVYVSCSVDQARTNFVDLCRPTSKRLPGLSFMPILAQPIDLFPHTAHCELVLLFERMKSESSSTSKPVVGDESSATIETEVVLPSTLAVDRDEVTVKVEEQ